MTAWERYWDWAERRALEPWGWVRFVVAVAGPLTLATVILAAIAVVCGWADGTTTCVSR